MGIYTITEKDKTDFENFFTAEICENIGKDGYFTLASSDDEGFVTGVLQFYVYETEDGIITSSISYIYVDEEFRNAGAGTLLLRELKDILAESEINEVTCEVFSEGSEELISLLENEGFVFDSEVMYVAEPPAGFEVKKTKKNTDKYLLYRLEVEKTTEEDSEYL